MNKITSTSGKVYVVIDLQDFDVLDIFATKEDAINYIRDDLEWDLDCVKISEIYLT